MKLAPPAMPREHGAWAVLYGSLLAGLGVAGHAGVAAMLLVPGLTAGLLAVGALATLASAAAAPQRRRHARIWLVVWTGVTGAALLPGILMLPAPAAGVLVLAAAGLAAARTAAVRAHQERALAAELLGVGALTLAGPFAHAVALGRLEHTALLVWVLPFLFFASGVSYVRMRLAAVRAVRTGRPGAEAFRSCLAYHLLLLVVAPVLAMAGVVPWLTLLAFAPALWRAAVGLRNPAGPLDVRRLGWS